MALTRCKKHPAGLVSTQENAVANVLLLQDSSIEGNGFGGCRVGDAAPEQSRGSCEGKTQPVIALVGHSITSGKHDLVGNALRQISTFKNDLSVRKIEDWTSIGSLEINWRID